MKILLKHTDGHTFVAKSDSNHWIPLDTAEKSGGTGAANDPFQLFIIAATGCMAINIVDIIRKSRKEISRFEVETTAARPEQSPKILQSIRFHIRLEGEDISGDLVERAINLSLTKYCSVSLLIDRAVKFMARYTLNGVDSESWQVERHSEIYYTS